MPAKHCTSAANHFMSRSGPPSKTATKSPAVTTPFEGRTFLLAVGNIMPVADFPPELDLPAPQRAEPNSLLLNGGSAIIAPDGEYVVEPVYGEETILYADLDLSRIAEEQMTLDVTGHYARDDIFTFVVNRQRFD